MHDPGKYRGITLLNQVLKLLERVLDTMIRGRVEGDVGQVHQGFIKGRGTADGMYVLRQMVEKRLEVGLQGSVALGFVDLEKVLDTVPREMVMATLLWMGVGYPKLVRMVEGTYEKTTARVVVGEGASEEFEVKIAGKTEREVRRRVGPERTRVEQLRYLKKAEGRNGIFGTDRTTTTKAASVRK